MGLRKLPECPDCYQTIRESVMLRPHALGEQRTRWVCPACGFSEVRDQAGRKLLTEASG